MNATVLLNPGGELLPRWADQLQLAKKTRSLWARLLTAEQPVETLEGTLLARAGEYLCRGIAEEYWPQSTERLLTQYVPSGVRDAQGYGRFDPRADIPPVEATSVECAFQVESPRGRLTGRPGDYVVRSSTDPRDLWVVAQAIFHASYELVPRTSSEDSLRG